MKACTQQLNAKGNTVRRLFLLVIPTLHFGALEQVQADIVDVFLLAGQSNAVGRGAVSEVTDPSILQDADVMLYHSPGIFSGNPSRTWNLLRLPGQGATFGPEIGFGNRMVELYPNRRIAIIKHAVDGTSLANDWHPGRNDADSGNFGPQFQTFINTVVSGRHALTVQGHTPVIRGMLWVQGERDARSYGLEYAQNLSHLIRRVREQLDTPDMAFVHAQVLPLALSGWDFRDEVRQAQLDVDMDSGSPYATDGARMVSTEGVRLNSDNLHYSAAGELELGRRFADAIGSVPVIGPLDFDGDGKIGRAEVNELLDFWHTDESAYDIAPPLFGDGRVDVQDLTALGEHYGRDLRLLGHWKLDEEVGDVAMDSAKDSHALVSGDPVWGSVEGAVGGAIHLDGIDDTLDVPLVLIPEVGPFSVYAWVLGGTAGQVMVSQPDGANWLMLHPADSTLMVELQATSQGTGRRSPGQPLHSSALVADGFWHHVGLVWGENERVLYVDGVEVARDTQSNLKRLPGVLRIGAGKTLQENSFWAGAIDDVRLYDRAVTPDEF